MMTSTPRLATTPSLLALTLERTSLDWMLANKNKFDDLLMRELSERNGLPKGSDSAKVRSGKVGDFRQELSQEVVDELDAQWAERVTPVIGFASYAELRESFEGAS